MRRLTALADRAESAIDHADDAACGALLDLADAGRNVNAAATVGLVAFVTVAAVAVAALLMATAALKAA